MHADAAKEALDRCIEVEEKEPGVVKFDISYIDLKRYVYRVYTKLMDVVTQNSNKGLCINVHCVTCQL